MPPRPKKKVKSFKVPPFYYIPTIIGGMSLITVSLSTPASEDCWMFNLAGGGSVSGPDTLRKTVVPGKVPSLHGLRPPHSLLRYVRSLTTLPIPVPGTTPWTLITVAFVLQVKLTNSPGSPSPNKWPRTFLA